MRGQAKAQPEFLTLLWREAFGRAVRRQSNRWFERLGRFSGSQWDPHLFPKATGFVVPGHFFPECLFENSSTAPRAGTRPTGYGENRQALQARCPHRAGFQTGSELPDVPDR